MPKQNIIGNNINELQKYDTEREIDKIHSRIFYWYVGCIILQPTILGLCQQFLKNTGGFSSSADSILLAVFVIDNPPRLVQRNVW